MENSYRQHIIYIKSDIKIISEINNLEIIENYIKNKSLSLVYLSDMVFFGWYENLHINSLNISLDLKSVDLRSILRIRIFDDKHELYIFKSGGLLKGRYRIDDDESGENKIYAIDARQYLYGTDIKNADQNKNADDDFIVIKESRGTELIVPDIFENLNISPQNRLYIKTRNYIDFSERFQASFVDSRFAGFDAI